MSSTVSVRDPLAAFPKLEAWDANLFAAPTAIFRGAPFWSWNGRLDDDRLKRHLAVFDEMGIGGAHVHARTGLETPYLGDEFMSHVRTSIEEAERRGMLIWLYDEDRWPSGFAGGLVTRNPDYRCRYLRLTRTRPEPGEMRRHPIHHGPPQPVTERTFVAAWSLQFDGESLARWRRIHERDTLNEGESGLYAYIEIAPDWSWFNNQQYANLLDPRAIAEFIKVTHERYREVVGDRFGKSIPAIFTDEPLFKGMDRPNAAADTKDLHIGWVDNFPDTYRQQFGEDVFDRLPAVIYEAADGSSAEARLRFRDHHTQRFADAFAKQIGQWCEKNGIALTGHMMSEQMLLSQSYWTGEAMRSLHHFQLPGVDMLCDHVEYTTAKQAQSVARQNGRPGVMSELYGVTGWSFPFTGHLRQGNWQAALGIVVRVHHLSWYSMAGEAKRDYPASIGWHVPWYHEYRSIEDHFARVAVAMQTGKPVCRVGMLHPIESFWAIEGPKRMHAEAQARLERGFADTLAWLIDNQIDADLLAESLLTETAPAKQGKQFVAGKMAYDVVVLPPLVTIRSSTLDRLESFAAAGGTVVSLAEAPALVGGRPSDRAKRASESWMRIEFDQTALMSAVEPFRDVEVRSGVRRLPGMVYQLRETASERLLFVCSNDRSRDQYGATLRVRGHWHLERLDTVTGKSSTPGETWTDDGWTETPVDFPIGSSMLVRMTKAARVDVSIDQPAWNEVARIDDLVRITLSEPNVLLLDRPEWKLGDGAWQPADEVLRVDNLARAAAGLPRRHGDIAQPWAVPAASPVGPITIRYTINCDVDVEASKLALERAGEATIVLDGKKIDIRVDGFYVDEDIPTFALPRLDAGRHVIEITLPFGPSHALEASYLLGDFGVTVAGKHTRITAPPRELAFGDYTRQGLPFYGGNVIYHCKLPSNTKADAVRVSRFGAPLLAVDSAGQRLGQVIHGPHRVELRAGTASIDITCFGDRANTFGPLHNCNEHESWWGPTSWRTVGINWNDAYLVAPKGILAAPILETRGGESRVVAMR